MSNNSRATIQELISVLAQSMSPAQIAETNLRIEIARSIRMARKRLGWTQKEFADKAETTQSLISRWESGDCNYTIETIANIASILGIDVRSPFQSHYSTTASFEFVKSTSVLNSREPLSEALADLSNNRCKQGTEVAA